MGGRREEILERLFQHGTDGGDEIKVKAGLLLARQGLAADLDDNTMKLTHISIPFQKGIFYGSLHKGVRALRTLSILTQPPSFDNYKFPARTEKARFTLRSPCAV